MMQRMSRVLAAAAALGLAVALFHPAWAPAQPALNSIGIPSFDGNTGWINSPPLTPADLRGKTVLVDFFEYTCINCLRTLPYLREWYKRYHKYGFEIIAVHTPEFGFSGERANIEAAARRLGITWPIVMDDHNTIWNRYHNDAWPHEFLFAPNEQLVESLAGEGGYPDTERKIQLILKVTQPNLDLPPLMALLPQDSYDKPGAVCYPKTAESLVGHQSVADASGQSRTMVSDYADTGGHRDGAVYLQGYWHMTTDAAVSDAGNGYFAMRYHAIQVEIVMRPLHGPVRVAVTQDGKPVARGDAGTDLHYDANGNSYVEVDAPRAYDVIDNAQYAPNRELRLMPQGAGLGIYDLAFESCEVPGSH
ncbi:MAG TPA: redoxin domain-containing protein [Candidatus Dormibacteraeota bacterium]|nr:redoxin domain-containing protein [Candidatus Dormibacteraeota bacterium]